MSALPPKADIGERNRPQPPFSIITPAPTLGFCNPGATALHSITSSSPPIE
jgi:hypothetical protein